MKEYVQFIKCFGSGQCSVLEEKKDQFDAWSIEGLFTSM
jgi:hypothetical protein